MHAAPVRVPHSARTSRAAGGTRALEYRAARLARDQCLPVPASAGPARRRSSPQTRGQHTSHSVVTGPSAEVYASRAQRAWRPRHPVRVRTLSRARPAQDYEGRLRRGSAARGGRVGHGFPVVMAASSERGLARKGRGLFRGPEEAARKRGHGTRRGPRLRGARFRLHECRDSRDGESQSAVLAGGDGHSNRESRAGPASEPGSARSCARSRRRRETAAAGSVQTMSM